MYLDPLLGRKVAMLLMIMLATGTDEAVVEISLLCTIVCYFHMYHFFLFPIEEHQE